MIHPSICPSIPTTSIHSSIHSSNVIGEWITPKVTGERPPPCAGFSLTQISENSALFYGGLNPDNGECIPDVYIVEMTRESVVCYILVGLSNFNQIVIISYFATFS